MYQSPTIEALGDNQMKEITGAFALVVSPTVFLIPAPVVFVLPIILTLIS